MLYSTVLKPYTSELNLFGQDYVTMIFNSIPPVLTRPGTFPRSPMEKFTGVLLLINFLQKFMFTVLQTRKTRQAHWCKI